MTRRASTDAGCPRAKAGGVECVVQWYVVNEVHESESKKVMKAEGGSGRGECGIVVCLGNTILVLGHFRESDLCVRGPSEKVKVSMV